MPPRDRAAAQAVGIVRGHLRSPRAADGHPRNRQRLLLDSLADPQPVDDRQRSRIQRVAAQLVAGKLRAIDEAHADAGPREHERGGRAGGPGADDDYVHGSL